MTKLRKIRCWVRVIPRRGVGKPTRIVGPIYRTKREAAAKRRKGELLVDLAGFYFPPLEGGRQ